MTVVVWWGGGLVGVEGEISGGGPMEDGSEKRSEVGPGNVEIMVRGGENS